MSNGDGGLETVREIDPHDWGKALLEEILFRAAREVSNHPAAALSVTLTFSVTPHEPSRTIEISVAGAVEPVIRTRVPLDG